jgi:predicted DNA-binding transcriptional regulator AlpA
MGAMLTRNGEPDELIGATEVGAMLGLTAKTILNNWRKLKLPAPIALGESRNATKRWWLGEVRQYVADRTSRRDGHARLVALRQPASVRRRA